MAAGNDFEGRGLGVKAMSEGVLGLLVDGQHKGEHEGRQGGREGERDGGEVIEKGGSWGQAGRATGWEGGGRVGEGTGTGVLGLLVNS